MGAPTHRRLGTVGAGLRSVRACVSSRPAGRPPVYCSATCRQRRWALRQAEQALGTEAEQAARPPGVDPVVGYHGPGQLPRCAATGGAARTAGAPCGSGRDSAGRRARRRRTRASGAACGGPQGWPSPAWMTRTSSPSAKQATPAVGRIAAGAAARAETSEMSPVRCPETTRNPEFRSAVTAAPKRTDSARPGVVP